MSNIERGSIWLANLNPRHGTEAWKTRPVLVMQSQALLDAGHPSTIIIPLTTNLIEGAEPLRIRIKARNGLKKDSDLLIDQIRAIDNNHLTDGPLAHLDENLLEVISRAIAEVIGR